MTKFFAGASFGASFPDALQQRSVLWPGGTEGDIGEEGGRPTPSRRAASRWLDLQGCVNTARGPTATPPRVSRCPSGLFPSPARGGAVARWRGGHEATTQRAGQVPQQGLCACSASRANAQTRRRVCSALEYTCGAREHCAHCSSRQGGSANPANLPPDACEVAIGNPACTRVTKACRVPTSQALGPVVRDVSGRQGALRLRPPRHAAAPRHAWPCPGTGTARGKGPGRESTAASLWSAGTTGTTPSHRKCAEGRGCAGPAGPAAARWPGSSETLALSK